MSELWWISAALLWMLVVIEAIAIWALARQIGVLQLRIAPTGARMANAGLELGEEAPWFSEQDIRGRTVTPGWRRGKPTLLIFTSIGCPACEDLYPAIPTLLRHESMRIDVVIVSLQANSPEHQVYATEHRLDRLPYMMSPALAGAYQVAATPYAILINEDGKVYTKGIANTLEHLESLLNAIDSGYPSFDAMMNAQRGRQRLVEEASLPGGGHDGGS